VEYQCIQRFLSYKDKDICGISVHTEVTCLIRTKRLVEYQCIQRYLSYKDTSTNEHFSYQAIFQMHRDTKNTTKLSPSWCTDIPPISWFDQHVFSLYVHKLLKILQIDMDKTNPTYLLKNKLIHLVCKICASNET
jgi:hypothetical protein